MLTLIGEEYLVDVALAEYKLAQPSWENPFLSEWQAASSSLRSPIS
jgi:hypothetical protein